jgi:hypothetical protein
MVTHQMTHKWMMQISRIMIKQWPHQVRQETLKLADIKEDFQTYLVEFQRLIS